MKKMLLALVTLLSVNLCAIELNQPLPNAVLEGDNGGLVKGNKPFKSADLRGKTYAIFYIDPDEKDLNESYFKALKEFKKRNNLHFQSVAIINLAATWKPNFVIEKILKSKQKEFPDTIYVKDTNKVLVDAWGVADDNSDVIIIDKNGKVLFYKAGKMEQKDKEHTFQLIKENS